MLDEISEMALDLQAKLLRVLQEREVERLGGSGVVPLDVRVLARQIVICHLRRLPADFVRTCTTDSMFPHRLPASQRPLDIVPLAQRFLSAFSGQRPLELDANAQRAPAHRWPGNIRDWREATAVLATITVSVEPSRLATLPRVQWACH